MEHFPFDKSESWLRKQSTWYTSILYQPEDKITADYDKSVDFTKYKTFEYYGWAQESDKLLNNLDKVRIEDAFANEFYARGLSYVLGEGELIVTLFIVVEEKTIPKSVQAIMSKFPVPPKK